MSPLAGLAAFLVTAAAVPLWNRLLRGPSWMDHPKADRHNRRAVPKTGGAAWLTAVLPLILLAGGGARLPLAGALAGAFLLGCLDDAGRVGPGPKWLGQTLLLAAAVWFLAPAGGLAGGRPPGPGLPPVALVLLAALAVQTALEIHDNMDGLLAVAASAFFAAVALRPPAEDAGWIRLAGFAGCGASLGVLVFNRPPARVFFGNSGSMAVALLVSLLFARALFERPAPGRWPVPWVLAAPLVWPLADLLFVSVRRPFKGRPPWRGGRDHTTHWLASKLRSDRAVMWIAALAAGSGLALACWTRGSR